MKKLRFKTTRTVTVDPPADEFVVPIGTDPSQAKALALWQAQEAREKAAADAKFILENRWCRCGHNEATHHRATTRDQRTMCELKDMYGYFICKKKCPAFLLERTTNGVS